MSKFNSRKIQDGGRRHFEIHFNGHNSVTTKLICTEFGIEIKNNDPETELTSYFTSEKIQDGGGRHFEKWFNGYISVAMAYTQWAIKKRAPKLLSITLAIINRF